MRAVYAILVTAGLAACSPTVPDSGRGVGFGDYNSYTGQGQGAAPMMGGVTSQPLGAAPAAPAGAFSTSAAAAAIANAQGGGSFAAQSSNPLAPRSLQEQAAMLGGGGAAFAPAPLSAPITSPIPSASNTGRVIGAAPVASFDASTAQRPRGSAPPAGITATVSEMAVVGGVSDEQDFDAVAARETIESDRARIERNRAQYRIDQPGALPQRSGAVGPSIVEFALSTQHPVGVKLFQRSPFRMKRIEVACAPYANDDLAQEAFLAEGGPNRDRLGLDPDGDGYACGWNPAPYRAIVP